VQTPARTIELIEAMNPCTAAVGRQRRLDLHCLLCRSEIVSMTEGAEPQPLRAWVSLEQPNQEQEFAEQSRLLLDTQYIASRLEECPPPVELTVEDPQSICRLRLDVLQHVCTQTGENVVQILACAAQVRERPSPRVVLERSLRQDQPRPVKPTAHLTVRLDRHQKMPPSPLIDRRDDRADHRRDG
jgi:hypothetical protein